jgi:hypothetical protein
MRHHPLLLLLVACNPAGDDTSGDLTTTADASSPTSHADPSTTSPSTSSPDPSTTDATTDAPTTTTDTTGAPSPGCADLPLCDDFESAAPGGPPDAARWTVASPNCSGAGTLAVDDAVAHSGARSLRVDGGGGYCDHVFIAHTAAIESLGAVVHGRVWLLFDAPLGPGHTTFMTLHDSADAGGKDLRMGGQSEIFMWNRESDDATLPALSPAGIAMSTAPAAGAWTCVEFMIDEDLGLLTTWVDGVAVPGLAVDAEPTPDADQQWHNKPMWRPSLTDFKLGWESYAGQTMTLHIDDVALAAGRIGCG